MTVLGVALDRARAVVAVDPGKVTNRVWVSNGAGLIADPVSLSVARDEIGRALGDQGGSSPGTWCRGRRVISSTT
jgi:hypothetical protein